MNLKRRRRTSVCAAGIAAAITVVAMHAAPAFAAGGSGNAEIVVAGHSKGRTLSGQGVKILAADGSTAAGRKLTLPIAELNPGGANPTAQSSGALRFKRGKKALALTGIHFDFVAGALAGKLGDAEMPIFTLGTPPAVNSTGGSIVLDEGKLRLTEAAASAIRQKLGLPRPLRHDGVGMIWLAAQAAPTLAAPQPVVSGSVNWGVLASWRSYVLSNFTPSPGPSDAGEITVSGGATANGNLKEASSSLSFPVLGGSFQKGLYGAASKLSLKTQGAVKFAKPMHCINEVLFSGIDLQIDGANAAITLDAKNEIGEFTGMACAGKPAVSTADVAFATLGSVTPSFSGNTVTWTAVPSTLTAAGSAAWGVGPPYLAGKALDAVTITVGLG